MFDIRRFPIHLQQMIIFRNLNHNDKIYKKYSRHQRRHQQSILQALLQITKRILNNLNKVITYSNAYNIYKVSTGQDQASETANEHSL